MAVTIPRGRARKPRSVVSTLAAMLLATELLVVILAALALLGLKGLPPAVALGGGGGLVVLIAIGAALSTNRVGIAIGWLVQVVLLASFAVSIPVGIVGVVFAAIWVYGMIVGRRIDRREARPTP
jgi:hypothetical protein